MSKILKDLEFTFTGKRYGTDGNDDIDAIGFGGIIYAGKGHDTITVGTFAVTAYTGDGHDFVRGGSAYLKIIDENGDLDVRGLNAWGEIEKSGHGDLKYVGASAAIKINHTGYEYGNINYSGAAIANIITRKGAISNINYQGAGGYNQIWHETNTGNMTFKGGGGYNKLVRTWFNSYQNSKGNINFEGLGGGNGIFSRVETGDIKFTGGGLENVLIREGKSGDIFMYGAGANNRLTRISRNTDTYKETSGNIYFSGGGGYNHIYSNIAQGNITFYGAGAYNEIIRTTQVHPHNDLLVEYTKAENIFLTSAYMLNLDLDKSINFLTSDNKQNFESGKPVEVKAIKSLREPNTYLFKTPGPEDTNLFISDYGRRDYTFNKVKIYNDPETGKLQYDSELWRITPDSGDIRNIRFDKKNFEDTYNLSVVNNCWNTLEKQEIIESPRFTKINADSHYQLSNLKVFQHINTEQIQRKSLETIKLGVAQELFKDDNSAECSGDINFTGGGAGNVIKSDVTQGDINFTGGGIANVIKHNSNYGNTNFTGGGAANIIVKKGQRGDLTFDGGGLANVLLHQSKEGRMNINATGATNVLIRIGDGEYKAHLTALGNVSIHKGQGDSHITMLGGLNTHTQIDSHQRDKALWRALGGLNVMTQVGAGTITSLLGGGGNVLTKMGEGDLSSIMLGGANIITHISNNKIKSNTYTITLGGLNILTKKGQGDILAIMGGGGNVLTHIGNGNIHGVMLGGANILTKVGNGDLSGIMLGIGNVLTHVGDGQTLGIMGAVGNIFTKVGNGTSMGAMLGGGNIFTHIGNGEAWALMGGLGNVYTKIGNGNTLALMIAKGNVFTHVGDGMSVALMLAIGNIATKVGDGMTLAAMIGSANIFTHIGHEETFAAMVGKGNVLTKVGNGLTLGLMLGVANIYTHVGDGIGIGLFSGKANIMTKVGNGTTLSAMFGKANIMTHIGDGITGILALGQANIITKVGDGIAGIIAGAKGNIVTHVGDGITAAILGGKANILTKVGDGLTVGLLISKVGNIMTHIGNSTTIGFAKGNANIITKVGYGLGINAAWGKANIFTHIGDGERYNFAKGNANIITKVGNGQETSVVKGNINIITHVGSGNNYTGAWGNGNVVTQIGDGRQVALAKGHANIVTMLGKGDNYGIVWGKANISTKVGNGTQVTIAKGQANITTTVGDGLGVTVTYGNANINTKVGNGVSVNVAWGKYNVSTKVGDGLNVSVMKGTANANIHVGNGLGINASYAKNNVIIKIGNGDIYSLSVASSNTQSNKLATFFGNIKQSVLGVVGSQAINYLVQGDDVTTSGSRKGKGAIHLIEKSSIDGFKMNKIDEVKSNIDINLKGHITEVETPSLSDVNTDESNLTNNSPNLIINGDFKHGFKPVTEGWNIAYTQDKITAISQYGHRASIDTPTNTNNKDYWDGGLIAEYKEEYEPNIAIYQDISGLMQNEVIELSFEYERQDNTPTENKLSVIWNGEVVFTSSSDDKSIAWQQQQIKLTANAENNRLIFTIPGSDGLQGNNYRLRNIVAKSAVANINKHISDSDATKNALADKKKADANRQKLTDEKQRLLDHISTTQTELESTDHLALEKNGHRERDAILEEANSVTHNLTTVGQTLEVLSEYSQDAPPSDQPWSEPFAEGILKDVQKSLINTKKIVSVPVNNIKTQYVANLTKVKKSIKKSEYGVIQSEEHCQEVQLDTSKAKNDADKRYSDAIDKKNSAQMAEKKASTMVEDARSRGDTEQKTATSISDKAQKEAKSVQLKESDKPNRHRAHGSGLSGEAAYVEGADDNPSSYIKPISTKKNDGRFNNKLTTFNQELLDDAQQAINRLSINAGIRQKSANVLPSFTSDLNGDDVATYQQPSLRSGNLQYHKIGAIAVNLSGLGESPIFETLKQKFNVKIKNRNTYFTFILEKNSGRIQKNIYLDNINDPTQQKIIEHFILANYSNFEAMPNELHLENDKIKSSHNNKDRILAEYVEHKWQMLTDSKVMSVDELHKVASVKGKIQGESYKSIITTLSEYHEKESNTNCLPIEKLRVLAQLRNQIDGYLLGHPDSERNDGLKQLQTQVNTRYKHASALIQDSHTINADSSFSRLYDSLSNANLKRSKHIYIDINGHFVTEGKNNLQGKNRLTSGKEVIERVKNAVEKEYGAPIANKVFSQFANNEFAENGEGIDVSGLKKIHRAIERELSPHSATLYIWKPSNHSNLGHATLQIGQGRLLLNTEDAQNNHKENYISWWPNKAKSYFDVMGVPSQPKESLASDVAAEENDGFGLNYKYKELNRYDRLMNIAKGETVTTADDLSLADAKNILTIPNYIENSKIPRTIGQPFIDEWVITQKKLNNIATNFLEAVQGKFSGNTITINGAMILLTEPTLLSKRKIPLSVAQPFIEQWDNIKTQQEDISIQLLKAMKTWIQEGKDPTLTKKRIALVENEFAEQKQKSIDRFKTSLPDEGRVFRINLEGLDVAAMQAEWQRIKNSPNGRYHLLTQNCSSIVAKILKAGGADELIGYNWQPKYNIWTPNQMFAFAQELQEAQMARQQSRMIPPNLHALSGSENIRQELENTSPLISAEQKLNIVFSEQETGFLLTQASDETNEKFIYIKNGDNQEQQKIMSNFILTHYRDFDSIPEQLYFLDNTIVSLDKNHSRILSEKVGENWQPVAYSNLMTADELTSAAEVTGKARGENYKAIIQSLRDYELQSTNTNNTPIDIFQQLSTLRIQINSYLLKHPDSKRNEALQQLRDQVDIRYKHASILLSNSQQVDSNNTFSYLYEIFSNANLKINKHIYLDENGNFVTKGKNNLQNQDKLISGKNAITSIKRLVEKEYGSEITNQVFNQFTENEFAQNGHGIDLSGLKKIHQAIEQQVSPISSTLYIWKPSKHSRLGHAALQIGSGRLQLDSDSVQDNHDNNYVSWWPAGSKSLANPLNITTEKNPDLKLRWYDLSQPVSRSTNFMTLQIDIQEEEKTNFKLNKDEGENDRQLKEFRDKTNLTRGLENITPEIAGLLLNAPHWIPETLIPPEISHPFIKQWKSPNSNLLEVSTNFSIAVKNWLKVAFPTAMINQTFALEIKKIKEIEDRKTENFKTSVADDTNDGVVFRINLEGLDAAAMQKEWKRINSQSDPRYQLLTKNCSSIVARILKAGGADQLIGHHWKPRFGIWTPNELYKFSQKIQEARLAQIAVQQGKPIHSNLQALSDHNKVAIDNDGTSPNERKNLSPLTRFFNDHFFGSYERRRDMTTVMRIKNEEKITLKGDAGRLTGSYYRGNDNIPEATDKKVVLFLHGSNSPTEKQSSSFYHYYNQQGIDMLAINMRGFGESDGSPTEQGMYADAQTMFRYLVNDKGIDPKNIIIHGYSMGAPIAAKLASDISANGQHIAGLFLDRPMPSMSKAIESYDEYSLKKLTGQLAKKINGQFSVEKNLQGFSKDIPIILLTDCGELGIGGEKMRTKLLDKGYLVKGERTDVSHLESLKLMNQYGKQIISSLLSPEYVNNTNHRNALDSIQNPIKKNKVTDWGMVYVKPNDNGGDSRFDSQIIIQTEDDPIVAQAASALAAKHAKNSIVVQLDADGHYRVTYGDPAQLSGKIRWQLVGHGRETTENNHLRLSNYNADELSNQLVKFNTVFSKENNINTTPEHISIVGCSLISNDKQAGFAHQFINALDQQGIRSSVSARVTEVAVDSNGHKYTKDNNGEWVAKQNQNKVVLNWNKEGKITTEFEQIHNGVAEGDIDLTKIGASADNKVRGAIADNNEVFTAPKKGKKSTKQSSSGSDNSSLSYSGNIQVSVGDGEFTTVNWGTSNLGIKVGTGGFKSLVFGDNNVMVHVGNGDSKHSVDIAGYQAFEGMQLFVGTRNVSFNLGRSNDLIVMLEKSIPTPPLINPFDGAARITKVLESIACSGENNDNDWLSVQNDQWTLAGAKKFAIDMSGIDQTSNVDYKTLTDLNSQNKRSSRGLKSDLEATLNKKYNQWLGGSGNNNEMGKISRAEQLRQLDSKIAFNFAIGGQGADIQVTAGNWNLMFGDNIQSIIDTNLGSLFGLMTQQFTATGMVETTFTYTPQNLPTKLKNKLLGRLASVSSDTTLGDIFGVDSTTDGKIISRNGEPIDVVAILKDMLAVVTEFGGEKLSAFTDPTKLLDNLQSSINLGKDGIISFAESHGLKEKATEDQQNESEVSINAQTPITTSQTENSKITEENDRPFGFNSLNIPNLFATIFNKDKQTDMRDLAENLKENLAADVLNMEKKTLDFLRNSGHLKGDGDIHVSLGNYNFNWGGDGNDLGAYLGDNNNFWGGRGSDTFYATGISNIFTGGYGNDLGVLMGRSNMMFGGDGDDTAIIAGRINNVYLGDGLDKAFVFGEGGEIHTNAGNDYAVTTGNYNRIFSGSEQDFVVTIGNHNQISLEEGNDFAKIFGNYNRLNGGGGDDEIQLMGYHAVVDGGDGNDQLIAASFSKFSLLNGNTGNDIIILGGYQNHFKGGNGIDSFLINNNVIDCYIDDISQEDNIVLGDIDWNKLWFERSGYDLKISHIRFPQNTGEQATFERIGSTTFTDYFNGNQAKIVIAMTDKDHSDQREYTALSSNALAIQIQAMSTFPMKAGASGFFDNISDEAKQMIAVAWTDTISGKGILV